MKRLVVGAIVLCLVGLTWQVWSATESPGEYAVLQNLVSEYCGPSSERIAWKQSRTYVAIGVLDDSATGRVWILLNAWHRPHLKMMAPQYPGQSYSLTEKEYQSVAASGKANAAVLNELSKHRKS